MTIFQYICVLDFEATCDNDRSFGPQEIIEFPSVLLQCIRQQPTSASPTSAGNKIQCVPVDEFQRYIKPVHNPQLTKFCTELTGISQQQVDAGVSFEQAVNEHRQWLETHLQGSSPTEDNILIVTCGDWDLKTCLSNQSKLNPNVGIGSYLRQWCNIKNVYSKFANTKRSPGMPGMLNGLRLSLHGRHHSGIDDCRNIARIVCALVDKGCAIMPTGRLVNSRAIYENNIDLSTPLDHLFQITETVDKKLKARIQAQEQRMLCLPVAVGNNESNSQASTSPANTGKATVTATKPKPKPKTTPDQQPSTTNIKKPTPSPTTKKINKTNSSQQSKPPPPKNQTNNNNNKPVAKN